MILHDTTHDMYLPDKRAKASSRPKYARASAFAVESPTRDQKQAWMRDKQTAKRQRFPIPPRRKDQVRKLLAEICERHGIKQPDLYYGPQTKGIVRARVEACEQLRLPPFAMSFPEIGECLGMHHTTILYHCHRASIRRERERLNSPRPAEPRFNPDVADESGVWAI